MRPLIGLAVRLAFAAGAIAVLFHFVPSDTVVATLTALPAYLAARVLLQFVLRAVATLRIKIINDGQSPWSLTIFSGSLSVAGVGGLLESRSLAEGVLGVRRASRGE